MSQDIWCLHALFVKYLFIRLEISKLELCYTVEDETTSHACVSALPHLHACCEWTELKVCGDRTLRLPLISWMLAASQGRCAYFDSLASWSEWNRFVLLQQYFHLADMVPETTVVIKCNILFKAFNWVRWTVFSFSINCSLFSSDPFILCKI